MTHRLPRISSAGIALGVLALALAPGLASQQAQQQPPQQQRPPAFRGGTTLVTVDVYPRRDGKIIEGLTAADFELLEDGKPQAIEHIEFVRIEPATPEAARRDPNNQREMLEVAADPRNRVFVAFLDIHHTSLTGSKAIRQPFVNLLERVLGPTDLFGVTTTKLDPKLLVLGRRLLSLDQQLDKYWSWGQRDGIARDYDLPIETDLYNCFESYYDPTKKAWVPWTVDEDGETRWFYDVLIDRHREDLALTHMERLVEQLAGLREARTVIFIVSDGWLLYRPTERYANELVKARDAAPPVTSAGGRIGVGTPEQDRAGNRAECNAEMVRLARLDNERRLQQLIDRANRFNITFHPVSPSGLGVFDVNPSGRIVPPGGSGIRAGANASRRTARLGTLRTLAGATDGVAVIDANDLNEGLRRLEDDMSAYYLLQYYPAAAKPDGAYHRITVKVKSPGVDVRARRGYVAPTDSAATSPMMNAARNAGTAAPAEITAALEPLSRLSPSTELFSRIVRDGDALWIVGELPARDVGRAPWSAGADLQVLVTNEAGATVGEATTKMAAPARGAIVRVPLAAAATGAGALRVVTKLTADGRALEDRAEAPSGAVASAPAIVGAPLLFRATPAATSPLRPVADLQYRRTERLHVEWAIAGPLDQRTARLLSRAGQPLPVPVRLSERELDGRQMLAADVNLAPLAAGDYVLELVAARAGAETRTLVGFRVLQ